MTKKKLAQGIVKGRYVLLTLMAVCAVLSALSIGKTRINYDLTRYLSDHDQKGAEDHGGRVRCR